MKYLIINADDFGYSQGINKGIIEAHVQGILTSTSLMVDEIAAHEASTLKDYNNLSVGLHFVASNKQDKNLKSELHRQLLKYKELVGREPDHIDTHKMQPNAQPSLRILLQEYSEQH